LSALRQQVFLSVLGERFAQRQGFKAELRVVVRRGYSLKSLALDEREHKNNAGLCH
jgi:hypothetical protein